MALIVDFSSLQTAVAEWLWRTGDTTLTARVPDFIALFEAEFISDPDMRTFEMETTATLTIADTDPIALPSGYLEMVRARVVDSDGAVVRKVTYCTPDEATDWDTATGITVAKNYTILAGNFIFAPQSLAPVGDYVDLAYYKFLPLSVSNTTNWLLTKYPNIYLYGSLMQAAAYIDDKETVQLWSAGLDKAISKLSRSDQDRKQGAGPLAMRPSQGFIR